MTVVVIVVAAEVALVARPVADPPLVEEAVVADLEALGLRVTVHVLDQVVVVTAAMAQEDRSGAVTTVAQTAVAPWSMIVHRSQVV